MQAITVDILICTYKRAALLQRTLDAIEWAIAGAGLEVRIIVVDNDSEQSAKQSIMQRNAVGPLSYFYFVEPVQNISRARNTALNAASADFIILLDDDGAPRSGWLSSLLETAQRCSADVVFAPVVPEYAPDVPGWIRKGGFFESRRRFPTGTDVPDSDRRTGNTLLRSEIIARTGVCFDPELGLSGGEDTAFFSCLERNGARQIWCDDAMVDEWVPASRGSIGWLLRRSFRVGSVRSYIDSRQRRVLAAGYFLLKGSAHVVQGSIITLINSLLLSARAIRGLQKISVGVGMYYGIFVGPYQEYRGNRQPDALPSKNTQS